MVRREDIISVAYQGWLLIMSGVAIFTESIPHVGSSLLVHVFGMLDGSWGESNLALKFHL